MKTVQIGIGTEFANNSGDPGLLYNPAVAVNANNKVISMYGNEVNTLYYNIGTINGAVVDWGGSHRYDDGAYVAVAMNNHNEFVEVHRSGTFDDLWWYGGKLQSNGTLKRGEKYQHGNLHDGTVPSIALSNSRIMIGAYQESNSKFKCRIGTYEDQSINFLSILEVYGTKPCVAFNQTNDFAVAFLDPDGDLSCKVGVINFTEDNVPNIIWQTQQKVTGVELGNYADDTNFSIAYSEGVIVITYHYKIDANVYCELKSISGTNTGMGITWDTSPRIFDYGLNPNIAANDRYLVQVHKSENLCDIYYSVCLVTDHARWMEDLYSTIHNRYLWQIVMPASHDAGMYQMTLPEARTQDLSIRGQLQGGVRYFDLRPAYDSDHDLFYINHNGISGATLDEVLQDVYDFMHNDQSKELVILKFSHFDNFGIDESHSPIYVEFAQKITTKIGIYLLKTFARNTKFGTIPFSSLIGSGGKVMVVCDEYTINTPIQGIFTYRDGSLECQEEARTDNPTEGNLVVWDCYSNSTTTSEMETQQLEYLSNYTGKCDGNYRDTDCDMFLLSWTLTPWTRSVWQDSENPDRDLGKYMNTVVENQYGQIPNLLYVNYFEFARVTDIAIMLNQRLVATRHT
jgi:hypothetical protein